MEQFKQTAQLDLPVIHYKGGGPAIQDLIAGHIPMMFEFAGTIAPHVRAKLVRPLMTACAHRIDTFPQVPSAPEAGYPGFGLASWGGLFAPKGTPKAAIDLLNREVNKILIEPAVMSGAAFQGAEVSIWTPEQFAQFIAADRPKWAAIAKAAGIEPQ
jgi:tripartite-type tricarboxylate transporter receptor subunit TctC